MKIPCAFHWNECIDPTTEATHRCELRKMQCPFWVKAHLSESCPFLGNALTLDEITEYEMGDWQWRKEGSHPADSPK